MRGEGHSDMMPTPTYMGQVLMSQEEEGGCLSPSVQIGERIKDTCSSILAAVHLSHLSQ